MEDLGTLLGALLVGIVLLFLLKLGMIAFYAIVAWFESEEQ